MRSYTDFARRSPVPNRGDGQTHTARNAMSMVNISRLGPHGELFHFDGEFSSLEDLVRGGFTGRNYGWLPNEGEIAIAHIARIIRRDDGRGQLAREFGGSYRRVLAGTARDIPAKFRLPPAYRLDVTKASDREIVDLVARLVSAYIRNLAYSRDKQDHYNGSPYDHFLKANRLPSQPAPGEHADAYRARLLNQLQTLKHPRYITPRDGTFKHHAQAFVFGPLELQGLKLFLAPGNTTQRGGNCAACHTPPHFSDFRFHNTGLSQQNYDRLHGVGAFARLDIPELAERNRRAADFLPPSSVHPHATGRFRAPADKAKPGFTDLGLWNVFANPAVPNPQSKLRQHLCDKARERNHPRCDDVSLLPLAIAAFKTPVVRNLGQSDPYMHTGQFGTLNEVVSFYVTTSALAKQKRLRNGDSRLARINLNSQDIAALVAFLRALNEDYD